MKKILYFLLFLYSPALFAMGKFVMDERVKQKIEAEGANPAHITIDIAQVGHIHCYRDQKWDGRISYWAEYEEGSVGGTLWLKPISKALGGPFSSIFSTKHIECNRSIRRCVDGVEHISEISINAAHYYLLHILYESQQDASGHMEEASEYIPEIDL